MEYLTLQGSCLLSILIPLNFAIGDYTLGLKELGFKKTYVEILVLILGGIGIVILLISKKDPYISFILCGGILVGIIQNKYIFRKTLKRENKFNNLEIGLKLGAMILGVLLIIMPYTNFFYRLILDDCEKIVCIICNFIYALWGLEKILFNGIAIYLNSLEG